MNLICNLINPNFNIFHTSSNEIDSFYEIVLNILLWLYRTNTELSRKHIQHLGFLSFLIWAFIALKKIHFIYDIGYKEGETKKRKMRVCVYEENKGTVNFKMGINALFCTQIVNAYPSPKTFYELKQHTIGYDLSTDLSVN